MDEKIIERYLREYLGQYPQYIPSEKDKRLFAANPVGFIFQKLTRKKFRRKKQSESAQATLFKKINLSVSSQKPLHLVIPFGGYKHFWNPSHPLPDWAELFHFRYLLELLSPIAAFYPPGVDVEYISEDLILNRMNNYPPAAMDNYATRFKDLVAWEKRILPPTIRLSYFRVSERCDPEKIIADVEKLLPERLAAFNKLAKADQEKETHRSIRSVFWNGHQDLTKLTDESKRQRIVESRIIELAYYDTEARPEYLGDYLFGGDHICICFSFGLSPDNTADDLTLGSAHGSIVDFWIGRGILEKRLGVLFPRIISRSQYEMLKPGLTEHPVSLSGLTGDNYRKIEVVQTGKGDLQKNK